VKGSRGKEEGRDSTDSFLKKKYIDIYRYKREYFGSLKSDFRKTKPEQDQESLMSPEV